MNPDMHTCICANCLSPAPPSSISVFSWNVPIRYPLHNKSSSKTNFELIVPDHVVDWWKEGINYHWWVISTFQNSDPDYWNLVLLAGSSTALFVASPPVSTVTWHVIFWVLLSLAINSMAQSSGKMCGVPSRYRIYLSSSPILCLADAVSAVIRLVTTIFYLRVNPKKASQLVVMARSEPGGNGRENQATLAQGLLSYT